MIGRKRFLIIFSSIFVLISCESGNNSGSESNHSGGTFKYCEENRIDIIHPTQIFDASSKRVASQVFEGLVKLDPIDLDVVPCIADTFIFNPKNFTYTFQIKKGVMFHDDQCFPENKGREVNADDVLYTFNQICKATDNKTPYFNVLKGVVKGADDYFSGKKESIEGIRKTGNNTIEIQLIKPNSSFLKKLAGINFSIIAKEAFEKYGNKNKVGTGAFIARPFDSYNDQYILTKNPKYHGKDKNGDQLPYLDSIIVVFDIGVKQQMEEVVAGNLSMALNLSVKAVRRVLRDHSDLFDKQLRMQNSPLYSTYFIEFNLNSKKLKNKNFRKAVNYAINKSILTQMIFGETRGKIGDIGITHPSLTGYRTGRIKGYTYNMDTAKAYLAKANLSSLPELEIEIGENDYKAQSIADELRLQLEQNLGIQLKINVVPELYKIKKSQFARGDLAISSIVSEYASPEGFLNMFYGRGVPASIDIPSYTNTTRFKNKVFDKMMDKGRRSVDNENAYRSFASAERLLMEEAPIAVLWYEEANRLVNSKLINFPLNKLLYTDLSRVYFESN